MIGGLLEKIGGGCMGWEELLELSRRLVSELNDVKVELSLSSK
jgi:hypothetical protein